MQFSWLAQAHEFWLHSEKFFFKVGEKARLAFVVGENLKGEPWMFKKEKLSTFGHLCGAVNEDLKSTINSDTFSIPLATEGTHLLAMESTNAAAELDAEKFNAYLKEDGLDDAYAYREKNNLLNSPAKELYSRHTKLLLQAGAKRNDTYKKVLGWPVEIVPEKNPYDTKRGENIRFQILMSGKPQFGVRVKVWNRKDNLTTLQNIYTDKSGMIEVTMSNGGVWMVSVVRMDRSQSPQADWRSYWGSLVFGVN